MLDLIYDLVVRVIPTALGVMLMGFLVLEFFRFLWLEMERAKKREAELRKRKKKLEEGLSHYDLRRKIGERMAEGRREAERLRKEGYGFLPGDTDLVPAGCGDMPHKLVPRAKVLPTDFMPGGPRHGQPLNLPTMILTNKRPDELDPKTLQMIRETGAIVLPGITSLEQLGDAFLAHEDTLKARHKAKKKAPKKKR